MEKEWIEKHIDDMVQDICKLSEIPSVSVKQKIRICLLDRHA